MKKDAAIEIAKKELSKVNFGDGDCGRKTAFLEALQGKNIPVHYYVKYLNQQGFLFPRAILNAHANGKLSYGEMCRTLNVNSKHIGDIERAVMFR